MGLFATYLKYHRTCQGLSLRKLAELLGVNPSVLSRLEHGEIATPSDDILNGLPEAINRPKVEVWLAAQRISPTLAASLERGVPGLVEQLADVLAQLESQLGSLSELPPIPLVDLLTPSEQVTMDDVLSLTNDLRELLGAVGDGRITQAQFSHIAHAVYSLKSLVLNGSGA